MVCQQPSHGVTFIADGAPLTGSKCQSISLLASAFLALLEHLTQRRFRRFCGARPFVVFRRLWNATGNDELSWLGTDGTTTISSGGIRCHICSTFQICGRVGRCSHHIFAWTCPRFSPLFSGSSRGSGARTGPTSTSRCTIRRRRILRSVPGWRRLPRPRPTAAPPPSEVLLDDPIPRQSEGFRLDGARQPGRLLRRPLHAAASALQSDGMSHPLQNLLAATRTMMRRRGQPSASATAKGRRRLRGGNVRIQRGMVEGHVMDPGRYPQVHGGQRPQTRPDVQIGIADGPPHHLGRSGRRAEDAVGGEGGGPAELLVGPFQLVRARRQRPGGGGGGADGSEGFVDEATCHVACSSICRSRGGTMWGIRHVL